MIFLFSFFIFHGFLNGKNIMPLAYVAIGANLGDPIRTLRSTLSKLERCRAFSDFSCSSIYQTSPVSPMPQPDFLNAVCRFQTELTPHSLFKELQRIQFEHGQAPKSDSSLPRYLDLDLLFFGSIALRTASLEIPHPRWNQRLFVLIPLRDLTKEMQLPNGQIVELDAMIRALQNANDDEVALYDET